MRPKGSVNIAADLTSPAARWAFFGSGLPEAARPPDRESVRFRTHCAAHEVVKCRRFDDAGKSIWDNAGQITLATSETALETWVKDC
jgi:hypothetical protein